MFKPLKNYKILMKYSLTFAKPKLSLFHWGLIFYVLKNFDFNNASH